MREYFCQFHLHSCLSPCGDDSMTPADIAGVCALAGYDVAALTDHNTVRNCEAFCKAAEHYGILAVPGMELTTAEEVHVICLFPDLERAREFGAYVSCHLPPQRNRPDFFGRQLVMDEEDNVLDEEDTLLIGSTDIPICAVGELAAQYGGVAYPAHIDHDAFSLLSNLGLWMPEAGFTVAELSPTCPEGFTQRPDLRGVRFVTGCDAHQLSEIPDPSLAIPLPERSVEAVLDYLRG